MVQTSGCLITNVFIHLSLFISWTLTLIFNFTPFRRLMHPSVTNFKGLEIIQEQHNTAKPVSICDADFVTKSTPDRQSKLSPKFWGPYLVTEKLHGNKYKIFDNISQASEVIHVDRLQRVIPLHADTFQPSVTSSPVTNHFPICTTPHSYSLRSRSASVPQPCPSGIFFLSHWHLFFSLDEIGWPLPHSSRFFSFSSRLYNRPSI